MHMVQALNLICVCGRLYLWQDAQISGLAGSFQKGRGGRWGSPGEVPDQFIIPGAPEGKEAGATLTEAPEACQVCIVERAFLVAPVSGVRAHQGFFKHGLLVRELQLLQFLIDFLYICHSGASGHVTVRLCVLSTETEDGLQTLSLLEHRGGKVSEFVRRRQLRIKRWKRLGPLVNSAHT